MKSGDYEGDTVPVAYSSSGRCQFSLSSLLAPIWSPLIAGRSLLQPGADVEGQKVKRGSTSVVCGRRHRRTMLLDAMTPAAGGIRVVFGADAIRFKHSTDLLHPRVLCYRVAVWCEHRCFIFTFSHPPSCPHAMSQCTWTPTVTITVSLKFSIHSLTILPSSARAVIGCYLAFPIASFEGSLWYLFRKYVLQFSIANTSRGIPTPYL